MIGITVSDNLRIEDCQTLLILLASQKLQKQHNLDLLCCSEGKWKDMKAGAAWQDLRLGFCWVAHGARAAIVSDIHVGRMPSSCSRCFRPMNYDTSTAAIAKLSGNGGVRPIAGA